MNQETQTENPSELLDAITQTDAPCELVDEAIQTEPWLMAAEAAKWKQQALLVKAGMIPLTTHERTIQQLREKWAQELTTWNQKWEDLQTDLKELKNLKQSVAELQKNIQTMYNLVEQVLICRIPSPSFSLFLYEQMTLFKIKVVKEGRPHKIELNFDFMDTFSHSEI